MATAMMMNFLSDEPPLTGDASRASAARCASGIAKALATTSASSVSPADQVTSPLRLLATQALAAAPA